MGVKTTHDLNFPEDSKESRAFDALVQVIKNDGILSRTVKTFLHCEGSDRDFFVPTISMCPYLEIAPWPTESDWITEQQHDSPLTIRLLLAVQGTKFANIANYWHAVRSAIFPQDPVKRDAVLAVLRGAPENDLTTKPTITLPAYGSAKDDQGNRMLIADGRLTLGLFIKT